MCVSFVTKIKQRRQDDVAINSCCRRSHRFNEDTSLDRMAHFALHHYPMSSTSPAPPFWLDGLHPTTHPQRSDTATRLLPPFQPQGSSHPAAGIRQDTTATHLLDHTLVEVPVPVEAQLADPLKVVDAAAVGLGQLVNHVAGVHLDRDQRHNLQPKCGRSEQGGSLVLLATGSGWVVLHLIACLLPRLPVTGNQTCRARLRLSLCFRQPKLLPPPSPDLT